MLTSFSATQARSVLGAMLAVAATRGSTAVTDDDRTAIGAAAHYLFRLAEPIDFARLLPVGPDALAASFPNGGSAADEALRYIAVMAFVDGVLDRGKIGSVLAYAASLGIEADYLTEMAEAALGHVQWALADMTRQNMASILGRPWASDDAMAWFLPYRDGHGDPALAARFAALEHLPSDSFGRAFWEFYRHNGYEFPGQPMALNIRFATSHDGTHVMSGYDTSARGELLVSTFTASMHKSHGMAGHVLPVIFSWHLGIKINDVAKSATGGFDPDEFWHAWARGADVTADLFAPDWDFWSWTTQDLYELRERYGFAPA